MNNMDLLEVVYRKHYVCFEKFKKLSSIKILIHNSKDE